MTKEEILNKLEALLTMRKSELLNINQSEHDMRNHTEKRDYHQSYINHYTKMAEGYKQNLEKVEKEIDIYLGKRLLEPVVEKEPQGRKFKDVDSDAEPIYSSTTVNMS